MIPCIDLDGDFLTSDDLLFLAGATGGGGGGGSYGGITAYADNCLFLTQNGGVSDVVTNDDYFIAGIIDTGSAESKTYVVTRFGTDIQGAMRFYDNLEGTSVDYWTIMRTDMEYGSINTAEIASKGRYILLTILKAGASNFYIRYKDGDYLVKGSNV